MKVEAQLLEIRSLLDVVIDELRGVRKAAHELRNEMHKEMITTRETLAALQTDCARREEKIATLERATQTQAERDAAQDVRLQVMENAITNNRVSIAKVLGIGSLSGGGMAALLEWLRGMMGK